MANIDLTQWGETLNVSVAVDDIDDIVNIAIGNDDVFLRRKHAEQLMVDLCGTLSKEEE